MFSKEMAGIFAGLAVVVSVISYAVAKSTEEKTDKLDTRVNRAVDGMRGMTESVVDSRVSDSLVQEAIEKAAANKVASITRNSESMIRSTINSKADSIVRKHFDKVKSELDVRAMVEKKAHSIVANMTAYDLSPSLVDDVKREVIKEMKEQVKKKIVDAIV